MTDTPSKDNQTDQPAQKKANKKNAHSTSDDQTISWPLEAERTAMKSPLLGALQILAGHYGRRTSQESLSAGLPIGASGVTPQLFLRAAERASMDGRLVQKSLTAMGLAPNLPCILVLDGGQACILWKIAAPKSEKAQKELLNAEKQDGRKKVHPDSRFVVEFPETQGEKKAITLEKLEKIYTGHAFFLRPIARLDERAGPTGNRDPMRKGRRDWFFSRLWENQGIYREVIMAAIMINLFALASPLFVMNVYDRVVPNNAVETLWVLAAGVGIAYIFDFLLKNLRAYFLDIAGRRADVKISGIIFEQLMGMKMNQRGKSAGVMTSHMREFETIRDFFTSATLVTLIDLPFTLFFITVIFIIGGPVAWVPLLAMPIVIGVGLALQKPLEKVIKESMNESAMKSALLFESVTGLETLKVQAAEGNAQRRWEELTEKSSRTAVKSKNLSALALNWATFVQQITSVIVVIVGTYLIADGSLSMGALIACVILTGRAMMPLSQVAGLMTRLNQSQQSFAQLDELMAKDIERPRDKTFISMPEIKGRVECRDVVFHYPDQSTPAVNHLNLTLKPGEHIGIIGAVGSGKTTLQRLLLNLYEPSNGAILIDGVDVRQIDPGDLRRNIGVVQQSPQLFYGSVRENITMGHETTPDRAVLRAAELSGVTDFLRDSPHGLDTQVGERGESLSGGQRQAVAIARALLYDPPILIMDEPTAAMDPASENRLRKRLHAVTQGRTAILITHKGSMLSLVDRLALMDRGRIIADGPRDEVIKKLQANPQDPTGSRSEGGAS